MTDQVPQNENPTEGIETPKPTVESPDRIDEKKGNYYQKKLAEVVAEKEAISKQLDEERQNKLKEQNNYKELYELEKGKRSQAEEKAIKISQSYFNGLKMSAIEQEALKAGIHDSALEDLSLIPNDIVQIETTSTGNANVLGAKEFVEYLKEKKPYLFKNGTPPRINNSNPTQVVPKELSPSEIIKLQQTNPDAYNAYMRKRLSRS
jgi:hypothetical protein